MDTNMTGTFFYGHAQSVCMQGLEDTGFYDTSCGFMRRFRNLIGKLSLPAPLKERCGYIRYRRVMTWNHTDLDQDSHYPLDRDKRPLEGD